MKRYERYNSISPYSNWYCFAVLLSSLASGFLLANGRLQNLI